MAMIVFVLLALTTTISRNELVSDGFQQFLNLTKGNITSVESEPNDFSNVTENYNLEEMAGPTEGRRFWAALELQNRSILEGYTLLGPLSTHMSSSVTEGTWETELSSSSRIDGVLREYESPTTSDSLHWKFGSNNDWTTVTTINPEVTTSRLEDQVSKPVGDIWPVKLAAEVPGDVIIGGLMMVHEREDTVTCGPIMPQGGIQAVETMLYTLDNVNKGLEHFTIGVHILDDCDKDTYGLEMAVDFIKGEQLSL